MNGYWTAPLSKFTEKEVGYVITSPENPIQFGPPLRSRLGKLVRNNAVNFFARLSELGIDNSIVTAFPKDLREDFYAGRVVMIVRKPGVVEMINVQIVKKSLGDPPSQC